MNPVNINCEIVFLGLQPKIPISRTRIRETVCRLLWQEGIRKPAQITIGFVDDSTIRKINSRFLHEDAPTDVIAFDLSDAKKDAICADIIVSAQTAISNAVTYKTNPVYEAHLYVLHGLLHILGYDDKTARQSKIMQERAEKLLKDVYTHHRSHSPKKD